jgi:hypothetical protein
MRTVALWSARTCPRFETRGHVASEEKAATCRRTPKSIAGPFQGRRESRQVSIQLILALVLACTAPGLHAQDEPILVPDSVDYPKLLPVLPEAPPGWSADKPEGSTDDAGGFRITNVHRDYHKGEGENAPTAAISILDSVANPDYVSATTAAWNNTSETSEGYSKPVTIDGNPGFEAFENEGKHGTLWVMVAKRYFLQIELQNQDPKELQEWVKRVDLKKLAAIK